MMVFKGGGLEMEERGEMDKPLRDLLEIIQFTEKVSTKIHGLLDETEIYRTVNEEFANSKRYDAGIFLLTDEDSKLRVAETSESIRKFRAAEKAAGLRLKEFKIDLNKSSIYSQVVREGKTIQVNVTDLVGELLPRPLAYIVSKIMGYEKKSTMLTPLNRHGKIIGALAVSSPELAEHFIPSVRNLAQHISTALEIAYENVERKQIEEKLRESEEKYRGLVELAPDAIVTVNLRGVVTSANEATVKLSGYSKDEIVGKHFSKIGFLRAGDIPKYLKMLSSLIRGKIPQPFELAYIRKDGTIGWVEALNLGADAFVIKPVEPEKLLKIVKEKLKEQENAESMTEEKVTEWIKTRVRKLEQSSKTK